MADVMTVKQMREALALLPDDALMVTRDSGSCYGIFQPIEVAMIHRQHIGFTECGGEDGCSTCRKYSESYPLVKAVIL